MRTWLITGTSSGIGRGLAEAVLSHGESVVLTARNTASIQDLVDRYPDTAFALPLDVRDRSQVRHVVTESLTRFKHIDVLVNNAGYGYRSAIEEGVDEDIAELYETNLMGPIDLLKAVLPHMRSQRSGLVIAVSSIAAVRSAVGSGYYSSSKAALELIHDALAKEAAPLGIKVMIVEPGAFRTRFYDDSLKGTAIRIDDYKDTAGVNRKENIINKHDQSGDPAKAGEVIYRASLLEEPPLRLLLGSDAINIVNKSLQKRLDSISTYKDLSCQTDY